MKAVILSAGQGKRLLPLTEDRPKCTVLINGHSILEWQIQELIQCGISPIHVVVGFGAEKVESLLQRQFPSYPIDTIFNPFFALADNLISCWVARAAMNEEFILLNGDTLFESHVLQGLLKAPQAPITLVSDEKADYDSDDMKIIANHDQLMRIGKTLPLDQVNGESIGMIRFQREGAALFSSALDQRIRHPHSLKQWYLSLVDELAQQGFVKTWCIKGQRWAEIDNPTDLQHAEQLLKECETSGLTASPHRQG